MARTTIRTEDITASEVTTAKMATDPTNADNLASGSVPAARLGNVDTSGIVANQDDIALLGFKVAANGSLAKYNLVDQTIDAFEDASGVDASASTNETRDSSNYYSGESSVTVTASGGDVVTTDGDYTVYKFTSDGTYTTDTEQDDYEILVVGGGGAGGGWAGGGGGGGGGFLSLTGVTVTAASHTVNIGAGGASSSGAAEGGTAEDSTFHDGATEHTGLKGGRGGYISCQGGSGYGSGGGAGGVDGGTGVGCDANTENNSVGYAGGDYNNGSHKSGGGGGGGGQDGSNGTSSGGVGGDGGVSDIVETGVNVTYAGGGGGGNHMNSSGGAGGAGGGANGSGNNSTGGAPSAANNTGGGGGGSGGISGNTGEPSGAGGSGLVILRRPTSGTTYSNMTLISNATTAVDGAPTTGDLVITYTDGAGTATVNTDIKAYISRNGSAYTSAVTLVSQGTTGGHTILTANGVDLSGITTGTSMRWKIETLNQGVSKQTRIHAVSLGWS